MKTKTHIDSAGRVVIPKELRTRYGLTGGSEVRIVPLPDGISILPIHQERRVVRRGRVVTIDTGEGTADIGIFDTEQLRSEHFRKKHGQTE